MSERATSNIWESASSFEALRAAWGKVNANKGSAGGDGVERQDFDHALFENLTQLRTDILSGQYRPLPFRKLCIPKKNAGFRMLSIPSIRDRVLHTALATALTPVLEPQFEDGSFAYRPNRGLKQAVAKIEYWRGCGYNIVIEADIVQYFDHIEHDLLLEKLTQALSGQQGCAALLALIETIIRDQGHFLGTVGKGLAQGSPLSPLLSNLYLDALDEEIDAQGVKIIRFADDFVILCKNLKKAEKVLEHCQSVLSEHGLKLHPDGTRIVSFEQGFDFIGYLFLRTLSIKKATDKTPSEPFSPSVLPSGESVEDPEIAVEFGNFDAEERILYLTAPSVRLVARNRSFSVQDDEGTERFSVSHKRVNRIEIGTNIAFSECAVRLALDTGTVLAFVDYLGQSKGMLTAYVDDRAGLQFEQARMVQTPEYRLEVAKMIIDSRIRNQRAQLQRSNRRHQRDDISDTLVFMGRQLRKLPYANTISDVFGIEGSVTARYWRALGLLHHADSTDFRRSRPARDPLNAVINYLTGVLERDMRAAIQTTGLHQGFAFLHGCRDRYDGLVYDLMEPFRAPLTEGLALYLFAANRLRLDMFSILPEDRIDISVSGRRAIIHGYEMSIAKHVSKSKGEGKLPWRKMMVYQASSLAKAVRRSDPNLFDPFIMAV